MQAFNCDHCGHLVFFDSVQCLHCGSKLAFVPELLRMVALRPAEAIRSTDPAAQYWEARAPTAEMQPPARWRICANQALHQACNFTVREGDEQPLCLACRQTRWLPDLHGPAQLRRWRLAEEAKRQLFYTLARLRLTELDGLPAPAFEFLADLPGQPPVMTGHRSGTIVLNMAEADDDERARRRLALHEPYRTLEGHLRHESGHFFFWEQLVLPYPQRLEDFRQLCGDERQDYAQALQHHYAQGPAGPADWQHHHVSAYASAHPWEDWAETWAHYLHMVDLLETAASFGTTVTVPGEALARAVHDPFTAPWDQFDTMLQAWVPLTLLLNSLNRSLGQQDAYPFALSAGAMAKLRFVHELLAAHRRTVAAQKGGSSA